MTRRRDSSSLKIARSRNSRQTYSAPISAADARASSRRMAAIASASCSALPQSPGVIVAIVTGTARFAQQDQRARALKLHVVRMSMQGQDADRCGHDCSPSESGLAGRLRDVMSPLAGGKTSSPDAIRPQTRRENLSNFSEKCSRVR